MDIEQIKQVLADKDSKNNCTVDVSDKYFIFSDIGYGQHNLGDLHKILAQHGEIERLREVIENGGYSENYNDQCNHDFSVTNKDIQGIKLCSKCGCLEPPKEQSK